MFGDGDRFRLNGSLSSPASFGHIGAGGAYLWADPAQELLGVYPQQRFIIKHPRWEAVFTIYDRDRRPKMVAEGANLAPTVRMRRIRLAWRVKEIPSAIALGRPWRRVT